MPFNCDVCGAECDYSTPIFDLKCGGKAVICDNCCIKALREAKEKRQ